MSLPEKQSASEQPEKSPRRGFLDELLRGPKIYERKDPDVSDEKSEEMRRKELVKAAKLTRSTHNKLSKLEKADVVEKMPSRDKDVITKSDMDKHIKKSDDDTDRIKFAKKLREKHFK